MSIFHRFAQWKNCSPRVVKRGENRAKVICVDDHGLFLSRMVENVREAVPHAEVVGFDRAEDAMSFASAVGCDVLLTEIELYGKPMGLELARRMQQINQKLNIIFVTVCSPNEYAKEVMALRPSGYLTKVVQRGEVEQALHSLLYPV